MAELYYGVAYYDEYMPEDRLEKDIEMMLAAGINVVRIAESTWSTLEPAEGTYNFYHIDRVLDAMHAAGIAVIIGTPTYAIPAWLAKKHPEVMVTTVQGTQKYGPRQIMDIVNPVFRRYAENIIRVLMAHVCQHPAVIGYQLDNETKHYDNTGHWMQSGFIESLKVRYPDTSQFNHDFGLDYWSNRIDDWADFPPVESTINASLACAFSQYQREQVTAYLAWQGELVREYCKPGQFITHNFDFEWRGYSYGVQPRVDHFAAARALTVAGVDIYHPTQDHLTGREIAFGGAITRGIKQGANYFVLETQAQGFPEWTPYPGQLRLQAFSHIAQGARMVSYWHWHSIHNSFETYWKGLLSHDFAPNPTWREACTIGKDFAQYGEQLSGLSARHDVAILISNEAMDALNHFPPADGKTNVWNDIFRRFHDALYDNNVGVDIINDVDAQCDKYKVMIIPALYSAPDGLLSRIHAWVERGGRAVISFKSGFSDENVKVRSTPQPGGLRDVCGVTYNQFTRPDFLQVDASAIGLPDTEAELWAELLTPDPETEVMARYRHPAWGQYAAVTRAHYGKGQAMYVGFLPEKAWLYGLFSQFTADLRLSSQAADASFPVIVRRLYQADGQERVFIFNYSPTPQNLPAPVNGVQVLQQGRVSRGRPLILAPWDTVIIASDLEQEEA